jgi:hypothetical protein
MYNADRMLVIEGEGSDEDEDQAIAETDVVSREIYSKNNGFICDYSLIKDGLLQKTGIEKISWDVIEEHEEEQYEGVSAIELAMAEDAEDIEIVEQEEVGMVEALTMDEAGNTIFSEEPIYNIVVRRTITREQVRIEPIPPEDFGISKRANSIDISQSPFVYHRVTKAYSEWLADGFSKEDLDRIPSGDDGAGSTVENARENYAAERDDGADSTDPSQRELTIYECYARVDVEGNDKADLWKFHYANGVVLEQEKVKRIPFNGWTPIILPHKFHGLGLADLVTDLDEVHTVLTRQTLDNVYLANNNQNAVSNLVNIDDLLTPRPGNIVRVDTDDYAAGHIAPMPHAPIIGEVLELMRYNDEIKQKRTGVNDTMQGMNQSMVSDTAHAVERLVSKAEQKLALIVRVLVEVALKKRWLMVHDLLREYGGIRSVKINGQWQQIDTTQWQKRGQCEVRIGLGVGEREKMLGYMMQTLSLQKEALAGGGDGVLTDFGKVYNTLEDISRMAGIKTFTQYWINPNQPGEDGMTPLQKMEQAKANPPPDPQQEFIQLQAQIEQMKAQTEQQKMQLDAQMKSRDQDLKEREIVLKEQELVWEMQVKEAELSQESEKSINELQKTRIETEGKIQEAQIEAEARIAEASIVGANNTAQEQEEYQETGLEPEYE